MVCHDCRNSNASDIPLGPRRQRLLTLVLAVGAFATALNVTMLSPLLKPIATEFNVSDAATGQLATLTATCAGLTALAAAPWIDRFSRRAWFRFECVLLAAGTLLSAMAPSIAWLFVGRALAGIGGAFIFALCLASLGDIFSNAVQRNRAIGLVGTAATLGAVVGLPIMTRITVIVGWRWGMSTMIPLAVIVFGGSGWLPVDPRTSRGTQRQEGLGGYGRVLASRETVILLCTMIALSAVWFGWLIYFGAYASTVFGVKANTLQLLFLVGGGSEIVGKNLAPFLLRRFSARSVLRGGAFVLSADLVAVGAVRTNAWALFPFIAVASLASVILFTSVSILLLDALPANRGAVMALQSASFEAGGAVGAAGVGAGLTFVGGYRAVYQLLGLVLPLAFGFLAVASRSESTERVDISTGREAD